MSATDPYEREAYIPFPAMRESDVAGTMIVKVGHREKTLPYDASAQDIRNAVNELSTPTEANP